MYNDLKVREMEKKSNKWDNQEIMRIALGKMNSDRERKLISKLFGENDEPNKSFRAAFAEVFEELRRYYEGGKNKINELRYCANMVSEIVKEMPESLKRGYSDVEVAIALSLYAKNVCKEMEKYNEE